MKWYKRAEFEKDLKKIEKKLQVNKTNLSIYSDYELQRYFQRLKRIEKAAKK